MGSSPAPPGSPVRSGCFPERVDSVTGELLGNFPQAFSHLGVITAAQARADAQRAVGASPEPPARDAHRE